VPGYVKKRKGKGEPLEARLHLQQSQQIRRRKPRRNAAGRDGSGSNDSRSRLIPQNDRNNPLMGAAAVVSSKAHKGEETHRKGSKDTYAMVFS
jgi:hypothetical protein